MKLKLLYDFLLCEADHEYTTIFHFYTCLREIIDIFPLLKKTSKVGFILDTINARTFKLCMIIILLEVYILSVGLMTLTTCVSDVLNCKVRFLSSVV